MNVEYFYVVLFCKRKYSETIWIASFFRLLADTLFQEWMISPIDVRSKLYLVHLIGYMVKISIEFFDAKECITSKSE